jgi:hypothetical protein
LIGKLVISDEEYVIRWRCVANVYNVSGKFEWKIRITEITLELLTIIRETENEDFNIVVGYGRTSRVNG